MARSFNGTADYLAHAVAVVSDEPLTMVCWFRSASFSAVRTLMSVGINSGSSSHRWNLRTETTRAVEAGAFGAAFGVAVSTNLSRLGHWHHACGVFAADADRRVYLDGSSKGTNTTSVTVVGPDTTAIGMRYGLGTPGGFWDGLIAEAAIWNVALDDGEAALLAQGYSPLLIRPASLVSYWPLVGQYSPDEIDLKGRFDATVVGAKPAIADHPPLLLRTRRHRALDFISFLRLQQIARPDSDITPGGWTPSSGSDLYAMVDEAVVSDADYILSNTGGAADAATLGLSDIGTPIAGDVSLKVRHRSGG
jgi:hypothetical protein